MPKKLPPGAIGWTPDGRPIIPRKGEDDASAVKRVTKHKVKTPPPKPKK